MFVTNQNTGDQNRWDHAGIGASFLCMAHCLATPFVMTALPVLASTEAQAHGMFAIAVLMAGMFAFIPGYRKHRQVWIPITGAVGISMIIVSAMLPEAKAAEAIETAMVVAGGATLILAHIRNSWWCRFCSVCGDKCSAVSQT